MAATYSESNKSFINPYNFIPANWEQERRSDVKSTEEKLVSGILSCTILTRTPLAVPDTDYTLELTNEQDSKKTKEQKHKKYSFFHYTDGNPVIPGSTIRGAVRSVYETVTDSCFVTSNIDEVITSRGKNPFLPGVLLRSSTDKNKWVLHEAERFIFAVDGPGYSRFSDSRCLHINIKELEQYSYGQEVFFHHCAAGQTGHRQAGNYVSSFSTEQNGCTEKGYLFLGEKFARKHFESIFQIKEFGEIYDVETDSRTFQNLIEIHRVYNNEKINKNLEKGNVFYSGFEAAMENGVIPIWYQAVERQNGGYYLSLSFACIGRQAYENTMGKLLKEKKPCKKRAAVCKACALFGMAGEESLGSRIRITDAVLQEPKKCFVEDGYHVLKELASPKISYLPFYTNQPGMSGWSYDNDGVTLRGRKYYWHNMQEDAWKAESLKNGYIKTERNATMQLVEKNVSFSFDVYYDQITQTQLDELIWTLTLGENWENSDLCYKIGHGKPIGLGSAKILVTSKTERCFDQENGYVLQREEDYIGKPVVIPTNISHLKELQCIMNINTTAEKLVCYPFIDTEGVQVQRQNDTASHKWFNKNYQLGNRNGARQPWKGILKAYNHPFHAYKISYGNADPVRNLQNAAVNEGETFQAVVTGHDEKCVHLSFQRNGRTENIRIHCRNIKIGRPRFGELGNLFPDNTCVEIKYMGKENRYDQWHCIKKSMT